MRRPKYNLSLIKRILQISALLLHLFILAIGCSLIYQGITWSMDDQILSSYFVLFFGKPGNTVILVGSAIVLISCVGFVLTCFCKDISISKMHLLFMVLVVLCQIAYSIDIFILNQLPDFLKSNLREGINDYQFNKSDEVSVAWDIIQENRKCCGIIGYTDWHECDECILINSYPNSCCKTTNEENCGFDKMNSTVEDATFYSEGCFAKFIKLIDHHNWNAVMGLLVFVIIQMLIISLTTIYMHIPDTPQNVKRRTPNHIAFEEKISDDCWEMTVTETTKMIHRRK